MGRVRKNHSNQSHRHGDQAKRSQYLQPSPPKKRTEEKKAGHIHAPDKPSRHPAPPNPCSQPTKDPGAPPMTAPGRGSSVGHRQPGAVTDDPPLRPSQRPPQPQEPQTWGSIKRIPISATHAFQKETRVRWGKQSRRTHPTHENNPPRNQEHRPSPPPAVAVALATASQGPLRTASPAGNAQKHGSSRSHRHGDQSKRSQYL